jgi:radical SAM superfamily enzyme YgiQ (UPF0313 family)
MFLSIKNQITEIPIVNKFSKMFHRFLRVARVIPKKELLRKVYFKAKGKQENFYPIHIPPIEINPGLDFLLLELPPRYMPMMPNGLGYVHNILKRYEINFQTIDTNIIFYHRYHSKRILEGTGPIVTSSGYIMKEDPWDNSVIDEWHRPEVIEYFWPQVEEILQGIVNNQPKIVGISVHANNRVLAREFIKALRIRTPEVIIVVGGFDCVHYEIGPYLFPDFDYMVIGEAEMTLKPLVTALATGEKPRDLPGIISYYDSPDRTWDGTPLFEDLDSIDFPKYEWIDHIFYQTYDRKHLIPITASRGCKWSRCRFCAECFPFRKRQPKKVADEIEYSTSKGFHSFHFNESDVNGDPENLYNICSEIINRGLKVQLCGQLRIDRRNTREYFDHLAKAGFTHLRFGVDGWSKNTLRLQRKGYKLETAFQNLRDCHASGIYTTVNIVIGVPGETENDVAEAIENMVHCKEYIDCVESFNTLILAGGSEYYKNPEQYKIRFRGDRNEIYKNHYYFIPAELWYSEDPYIDQEVRMRRLDKITTELYKQGVKIGAFAERVIENLKKGESYPMHEEA